MTLTIWLICGVVGFFLARASLQWHFGCRPITVGTLVGMLFVMWLPPLSFIAAVTWAIAHILEGGGFSFMRYEIANPCKWFHKRHGGDKHE